LQDAISVMMASAENFLSACAMAAVVVPHLGQKKTPCAADLLQSDYAVAPLRE
jgi:hypothetical protein